MPITRRNFLMASATIAAITTIPRPLLVQLSGKPEPAPPIDDPRLKALALRALDAARGSGASYADVRLTHDWTRNIELSNLGEHEELAVGVRALVDGYWGFASSSVWSPNEMARLGREAVHQAKTNALGKPRSVELAPVPAVPDGHWVMPVKVSPFDVHPLEIRDYLTSLNIFAARTPGGSASGKCTIQMQEKAFGSTDGSYCTQRTYLTRGSVVAQLVDKERKKKGAQLVLHDRLSAAGLGWELFRDAPIRDGIRRVFEEIREEWKLPVNPVDVGRYDTVFDAAGAAAFVDRTLGRATELDRALGYEANAGGTSYLNDPFHMLGSYQAGAQLLTVTANRSEPGGAATVRWDDEGVVPEPFALVKDGMLTDFQTTRESAGWLKEYYARTGKPFRSHACATALSAIYAPLQRAPNIVLAPGREAIDFDGLVAGLSKGVAVKGAGLDMDFQNLNGMATGRFYEVKKGKRVARIAGPGILFRATELWKALLALGGEASTRRYGTGSGKGEPPQSGYHSVTAPPALFKQLTLIDPKRKA